MKQLVIDRKRWLRGSRGPSFLRYKGQMCCLGFYSIQIDGRSEKEIDIIHTPAGVGPDIKAPLVVPLNSGRVDSEICKLLMRTNDNPELTDADREAKLTELFASIDVAVTFTD